MGAHVEEGAGMGNAVVHFEAGAVEDQPLVAFYGELFGWRLRTIPGADYTVVDTRGGGGINGGIGRSQSGAPWSTFYVEADDLQAVLDRAEALGATTAMPVTEVPGVVTFAMFNDPDGLLVGLVEREEPREGVPPGPSDGDGAPVDWFEVLGTDAGRTQAFYTELFGWKLNLTDMPGYGLVDTQAGRGIQGGLGAGGDLRWATVYASVPDVEGTLARAERLGGSRVYGPLAVDDHMQTGAFRDPAGNAFGVYHHPPH
jgi:predicted enzyme related to lactoylglutathione lyase